MLGVDYCDHGVDLGDFLDGVGGVEGLGYGERGGDSGCLDEKVVVFL